MLEILAAKTGSKWLEFSQSGCVAIPSKALLWPAWQAWAELWLTKLQCCLAISTLVNISTLTRWLWCCTLCDMWKSMRCMPKERTHQSFWWSLSHLKICSSLQWRTQDHTGARVLASPVRAPTYVTVGFLANSRADFSQTEPNTLTFFVQDPNANADSKGTSQASSSRKTGQHRAQVFCTCLHIPHNRMLSSAINFFWPCATHELRSKPVACCFSGSWPWPAY